MMTADTVNSHDVEENLEAIVDRIEASGRAKREGFDPRDAGAQRQAFGDWVTARRESLHLSQSELAARADLTRSLMNAIERGKIGLPSIDKRRRLAEALRVRHIDLLVAAGEIDEEELLAGTPREFTKYPDLQRDIETLSPDAADALQDFIYLLATKAPPPEQLSGGSATRFEWLQTFRQMRNRFAHSDR